MNFAKLLGAAILLILLVNRIPASLAQADLEIKLKNRSFVPQTSGAMRVAGSNGAGRQHVILQFAELPDPEILAQYGIQPLNYIPDNAIMASVPAGFEQRSAPGVRWMGQLLATDKISAYVSKQLEMMAADQQVTLLVEAHPDVDSQTLASLAVRAGGTFNSHPALPGHLGLVTGTREVFQQLALDERIAWITAASDELVNGEAVYYCPGPITEFGPVANYVVQGDGWDGPGLGSAALTYHFLNGTPDIGGSGEEGAVRDALAVWASYVDLSFSETGTAGLTRSLDILWATGSHGDPYPFDGPSGILAHAYFPSPPNSETIAGDIHFDDDENWSLNTHIHMFTVALHESGHSLGLAHSDVPGSVMYPSYSVAVTDLQPDDVAGIRSLYSDSGSTDPAPDPPVLNSISNSDGDGSFTVSWPSVATASSYTLQEWHDGGSWNTIYSGNSSSQNINGRSSGEWCYRALASNTGGDSGWSNTQCATVTELAPGAPFLKSIANSDGDGTYAVSWSIIANATSYSLQEQHDNGIWNTIYNGGGSSQSINGRSPGEYCYRVLAANGGGGSAWSNMVCTTVTVDVEPCYLLTREHTGFGSDPIATPAHSPACPIDQYNAGTLINLSATPDSGWYVSGWSRTTNDASTAIVNSITMPAQNHSIAVHYAFNASDFHFIPFVLKG